MLCSLTGITSFSHLLNLENLDISYNEIESLARACFNFINEGFLHSHNNLELDCLRHLRELRADGNKITSVDGLQKMDGLVKLSLQDNRIQDVDLSIYRWSVPGSSLLPFIRSAVLTWCFIFFAVPRTRLEMLNLSGNRVNGIDGLASLPSLIALNIGKLALINTPWMVQSAGLLFGCC